MTVERHNTFCAQCGKPIDWHNPLRWQGWNLCSSLCFKHFSQEDKG